MKTIMVVGKGILSEALVNSQVDAALLKGYSFIQLDNTVSALLDLEVAESVIETNKPDIIVYAESSKDVGYFEGHKDEATNYHVRPVGNLINSFKGDFIYVSSSHVFDGKLNKRHGYKETNEPNPLSIYGHAVWAGELILPYSEAKTHVIRTSSMFDTQSIDAVLSLIMSGGTLYLSDSRFNSPVHVDHLADGIMNYVYNIDKMPNRLNIAGRDVISEFHFGVVLSNVFQINQEQILMNDGIADDELRVRQLYLPLNSGLDIHLARSLNVPIYSAYDGLKYAFQQLVTQRIKN